MTDDVEIKLSRDEAIVLFELLSRFVDREELVVEHQSEQRILWNLQASLEAVLHEPFNNPDYASRLSDAREAVRDKS